MVIKDMKALAFYMAYFRLPDNFSGNISDALRLMADYHEKVAATSSYKPSLPLGMPLSAALVTTFDEFLDAIQDGKRFNGLVRLDDFDPKVEIPDI
jgi:hypothetical protein